MHLGLSNNNNNNGNYPHNNNINKNNNNNEKISEFDLGDRKRGRPKKRRNPFSVIEISYNNEGISEEKIIESWCLKKLFK